MHIDYWTTGNKVNLGVLACKSVNKDQYFFSICKSFLGLICTDFQLELQKVVQQRKRENYFLSVDFSTELA